MFFTAKSRMPMPLVLAVIICFGTTTCSGSSPQGIVITTSAPDNLQNDDVLKSTLAPNDSTATPLTDDNSVPDIISTSTNSPGQIATLNSDKESTSTAQHPPEPEPNNLTTIENFFISLYNRIASLPQGTLLLGCILIGSFLIMCITLLIVRIHHNCTKTGEGEISPSISPSKVSTLRIGSQRELNFIASP